MGALVGLNAKTPASAKIATRFLVLFWMAARASAPDNRRIAEKLAASISPPPERRAAQNRVGGEGDHRRRRQEADVPDPRHGVRRGHHRPTCR